MNRKGEWLYKPATQIKNKSQCNSAKLMQTLGEKDMNNTYVKHIDLDKLLKWYSNKLRKVSVTLTLSARAAGLQPTEEKFLINLVTVNILVMFLTLLDWADYNLIICLVT